jgi:hypothetical protein
VVEYVASHELYGGGKGSRTEALAK